MKLLLIFLPWIALASPICYFTPPDGWASALPDQKNAYVQIGFIGKHKNGFSPSLNFAIEPTDADLKAYLKAVREIQQADPKIHWRDLGEFHFKAGLGRLIEMSVVSPFGPLQILQGIFVSDGTAYIVTGSCLKGDACRSQILAALHSLTFAPDLFAPIADDVSREQLKNLFQSLGQRETPEERKAEWETLQNTIDAYRAPGPHWQFLVLKDGYSRIYNPRSAD